MVRFKRRKSRFSFEEVQLMLNEVRSHRHILVGKFNRGVSADLKKRTWADITARINEISECPREVLEIIKKWSDLKCDTKRKVAAMRASGASTARISRDLSPIEAMVHQILQMAVPSGPHPYESLFSNEDDRERVPGRRRMQGPPLTIQRQHPPALIPPPLPQPPPPPSQPPPPPPPAPVMMAAPSLAMASKNDLGLPIDMLYTRNSPHPLTDFQFEAPEMDGDSLLKFDDNQPSRERSQAFLDGPTTTTLPSRSDSSHRNLNGSLGVPPATLASASSLPPPAPPRPRSGSAERRPLNPPPYPRSGTSSTSSPQDVTPVPEQLAQSASLSLQEQQAATVLMGSISRSLETMSESVQQLVETQQSFVRDSLQLQRDALHVLRDFSSTALTILQDKLNGRPLLP